MLFFGLFFGIKINVCFEKKFKEKRHWQVSFNNYSEIRKKNREKQELIELLEELTHEEKTLTDDEVTGIFNKVIADAEKTLGAIIRK